MSWRPDGDDLVLEARAPGALHNPFMAVAAATALYTIVAGTTVAGCMGSTLLMEVNTLVGLMGLALPILLPIIGVALAVSGMVRVRLLFERPVRIRLTPVRLLVDGVPIHLDELHAIHWREGHLELETGAIRRYPFDAPEVTRKAAVRRIRRVLTERGDRGLVPRHLSAMRTREAA